MAPVSSSTCNTLFKTSRNNCNTVEATLNQTQTNKSNNCVKLDSTLSIYRRGHHFRRVRPQTDDERLWQSEEGEPAGS